MLPDPALSLTIPSIHDHTVLDCRIYHPQSLSANPRAPAWKRHAAILAHPYAPLGGCFDDPILAETASQLLRTGYLVATFNFRGAGGSAGRTSWTAKPEGDDYMSVIGFVVHYVHYLDPFPQPLSNAGGCLDRAVGPFPHPRRPRLIIGGYSYGSIITMQLPALDAILDYFTRPVAGTPAAQIRLRAEHLAIQYNEVLSSARESMSNSHSRTYGRTNLRVGGDEEPGSPRRSGDGERRSYSLEAEEKVRKGLHDLFHRHKGRELGLEPLQGAHGGHRGVVDERLRPLDELIRPCPSYLLISPVHGVAKRLALMSLWPSATSRSQTHAIESGEAKLVQNPTLAVYGDRDSFVSASKLRTWAKRLTSQEGSKFTAIEIAHGGHFWVEEGVLTQLKSAIEKFAQSLLAET